MLYDRRIVQRDSSSSLLSFRQTTVVAPFSLSVEAISAAALAAVQQFSSVSGDGGIDDNSSSRAEARTQLYRVLGECMEMNHGILCRYEATFSTRVHIRVCSFYLQTSGGAAAAPLPLIPHRTALCAVGVRR